MSQPFRRPLPQPKQLEIIALITIAIRRHSLTSLLFPFLKLERPHFLPVWCEEFATYLHKILFGHISTMSYRLPHRYPLRMTWACIIHALIFTCLCSGAVGFAVGLTKMHITWWCFSGVARHQPKLIRRRSCIVSPPSKNNWIVIYNPRRCQGMRLWRWWWLHRYVCNKLVCGAERGHISVGKCIRTQHLASTVSANVDEDTRNRPSCAALSLCVGGGGCRVW